MGKSIFKFDYMHYKSLNDMSADDIILADKAIEACGKAYAPYSDFRVGAAAMVEGGRVYVANNQESEVFPSGMCAERSLLYYLQAKKLSKKIVALAIASDPGDGECYPCGACRQVIYDTEKRQGTPIRVIMIGGGGATVVESARHLLPFTFGLPEKQGTDDAGE